MRILPKLLLFVLFVLCGLFSAASVIAADPAWIEVRSPHFRVLSDGSEKEARAVAREFEQIRSIFETLLPNLKLDDGAAFLILAPNSENSARKLVPEYWKRTTAKPGGLFHHGWEKTFAVVRLDVVRRQSNSQVASDRYAVIYHEYAHSILHANFQWLPTWVDIGLSEFFAYTRFERHKTYVGAPSPRASVLRGSHLFAIEKLVTLNPASPEFRDGQNVQLFYAEAWGLIHMLMVSPRKEPGKGLVPFLSKLQSGVEPKQAFIEGIGDFGDTEGRLIEYLGRAALDTFSLASLPQNDDDKFEARKLSSAETAAELGSFQVWQRELDAARPRLEQALRENPKSALAHEAVGFLRFVEGKDEETVREFEAALQLDEQLYLSRYYRAMLLPQAHSVDAADRNAHSAELLSVLEMAPKFAPAYVELANVELRQGKLDLALAYALRARTLAPSRAGYHTFVAQILHALGRDTEAASMVKDISERWIEIDRDEAIHLWDSLPQSVRAGVVLTPTPTIAGTQKVTGRIDSIMCNEKEKTITFVLDGGAPLTLSNAAAVRVGFSDTIWYGADHMTACHHAEGLTAIIQFKPPSNPKALPTLEKLDKRREWGNW